MASQYDKYRFKDVPLDDATFNARWKDIDYRLGALEAISFDFKADESALVATALTRINTELVPVIEQIQAFTTLADLLTAPSASAITVTASGTVVFQLDDLHRRIFAAPLFVIAGVTGRTDVWMAGQVQSWDADTGRLVVSITNARGSGTFATWTLSVCSIPPETPPAQTAADITVTPISGISASNAQDALSQIAARTDGISGDVATALATKAPLASPALTGAPTAPTTPAGTATGQLATTQFVTNALLGLINGAPGQLDTINELAAALGNDANFASTLTAAIAAKAPLASPALTGTPTAPTAASGTGTTQIATTAYAVVVRDAAETDVASASTVDLGAVTATNKVRITGTTTVTSFGVTAAGVIKNIRFGGALTLTHNATTLILPGGGNISVVAGDHAEAYSLGGGAWVVRQYQRADGTSVVSGGPFAGYSTSTDTQLTDYPVGSVIIAHVSTTPSNRNQSRTLYRSNSAATYFTDSASSATALTGTWRARGVAVDGATYVSGSCGESGSVSVSVCQLFQRVA